MAIGGLDKAGRLDQLRTYARCQVFAGYRPADAVRADVFEAVRAEERNPGRAAELTEEFISQAEDELATSAADWTSPTGVERLQSALAELRARGLVVLEAVDDHWAAGDTLEDLQAAGRSPRGIAYFTLPDVWHAVEHGMLEINVWHGDSANVAPGDALLDEVLTVLSDNGIPAAFDEGRIEATVAWQRRPEAALLHSTAD